MPRYRPPLASSSTVFLPTALEFWFLMESQRLQHPVLPRFLPGARSGAGGIPAARRSQPAGQTVGGVTGGRLPGAPVPQPVRRVAQRHPNLRRAQRPGLLRALLRPRQHDDRDRGRRPCGGRQTPGGALFRPHAGQAAAAGREHGGAAAEWPEDGDCGDGRGRPSPWWATSAPTSTTRTILLSI